MTRVLASVSLSALLLSGCLLDRGGTAGGPLPGLDGGARDGGSSRLDGGGSVVDASRPGTDTGPPGTDADGDGVPVEVDCDDTDAAVGRMAERGCAGPCGDGLERCTDGAWGACDAPATCDCVAGETRSLPCPMCGTQAQRCGAGGTWEDDGACTGAGACTAGATEMGTAACGLCGSGTVSQTRTCGSDCVWGPFVTSGACTGETGCMPGETNTETEACGACGTGTRSRTQTCNGSCGWDAFAAWGACTGESVECVPGTDEYGAVGCSGPCGGGSQARRRTCTSSCTWGAWQNLGGCTGGSYECDASGTDYCRCEWRTGSQCCGADVWRAGGCFSC